MPDNVQYCQLFLNEMYLLYVNYLAKSERNPDIDSGPPQVSGAVMKLSFE